MAQRRLNKEIRQDISDFLKKRIKETTDYSALNEMREALKEQIIAFMLEKYPLKDMKVLQKYEQAFYDKCLYFIPAEEWVHHRLSFTFTEEEEIPLIAGTPQTCRGRKHVSREIHTAIDAYDHAQEAICDEQRVRLKNFDTFVWNSRTFEQVVAVIPDIAALNFDSTCNLPTIMSPDLMKSIKGDAIFTVKVA